MQLDAVFAVFFCQIIQSAFSHQAVNPLNSQGQEHEPHGHKPPSGVPTRSQPPVRAPTGVHNAHGGPPSNIMDHNAVHDQEHIKEHLDGKVDMKDQYTDEEMQFHYFKIHDYDDNNMLDGLEIIAALTHRHKDHKEGGEEAEKDTEADKETRMSDKTIQESVDSILHDNDANHDGYIDYPEFVVAQRTDAQ